jgi:phosphoglycolate phosphatase-like HAD superfamily hydrolase
MLRLITDFDGPIVDVSERYYRVYQYCLEKIRYAGQITYTLPKAEFWQLKREQVSEKRIGEMSGLDEDQARKFAHLRRQTVHTLPYLVHDHPVVGAIETLEKIKHLRFDLVVMTMRRVVELDHALSRHDLGRFFPSDRRYCLSNHYVKTTDIKDKPLLMAKAMKELSPAADTWMVGDTEADIAAAKSQNIKIIGVLSGIRNRPRLESYEPDYIVNNLGEAVDLIAGSIRAIG